MGTPLDWGCTQAEEEAALPRGAQSPTGPSRVPLPQHRHGASFLPVAQPGLPAAEHSTALPCPLPLPSPAQTSAGV